MPYLSLCARQEVLAYDTGHGPQFPGGRLAVSSGGDEEDKVADGRIVEGDRVADVVALLYAVVILPR
jgi:hypothetical protein